MGAVLVRHTYIQPHRLSMLRHLVRGLGAGAKLHAYDWGFYPGADMYLVYDWEACARSTASAESVLHLCLECNTLLAWTSSSTKATSSTCS